MRIPITTSAALNRRIVRLAILLVHLRADLTKRVKTLKRDPSLLRIRNRVKRCRFRVCRQFKRVKQRIRVPGRPSVSE
jgi:hypothetical protein